MCGFALTRPSERDSRVSAGLGRSSNFQSETPRFEWHTTMKVKNRSSFVLGLLSLLFAPYPASPQSPAQGPDNVEQILAQVRPRPDEERWRLIPWGESLTQALLAAKDQNKPVFYFGYDGILDTGNC